MSNEQGEFVHFNGSYDSYIVEAKRLVEREITKLIPQLTNLSLREKIEYILQTKGKRLRPILVMLSGQSVGGQIETVKKLALSIELLHIATLIHDDVLDQDIFRRNMPTINAKWGIRDAMLVGDALASLSINLTSDYGKDIIQLMSQTCLMLSDGEYMDVENAQSRFSESDYIETIKRKSASLFKAATQCGAIACGAGTDIITALSEYGENFGLAYQIKDDLFDITSLGNSIPLDIKKFSKTLPSVRVYESQPSAREYNLEAIFNAKPQKPSDRVTPSNELDESPENAEATRYCVNKINQYIDDAKDSLNQLQSSVYKQHLATMAESLRFK